MARIAAVMLFSWGFHSSCLVFPQSLPKWWYRQSPAVWSIAARCLPRSVRGCAGNQRGRHRAHKWSCTTPKGAQRDTDPGSTPQLVKHKQPASSTHSGPKWVVTQVEWSLRAAHAAKNQAGLWKLCAETLRVPPWGCHKACREILQKHPSSSQTRLRSAENRLLNSPRSARLFQIILLFHITLFHIIYRDTLKANT